MELPLKITRRLARLFPRSRPTYKADIVPAGRPRVLVAGVYVGNKDNTIEHLVPVFARSKHLDVVQCWFRMKEGSFSSPVESVTTFSLDHYIPKWTALEQLIEAAAWQKFDYVVFCDDDIWVGDDFLDRLIAYQQKYDLALAQPSRTWRSFIDWKIVRRRPGVRVRETNFVESGPVVSMDRRFLPLALPFAKESPMGWGYDLVWPIVARKAGLKVGIVDAVPVCHSLRGRGQLYADKVEGERMAAFLSEREHIKSHETLTVHR